MNHHPRLLLTSTLFPEDSPTYIISLLDPPEKMREKQRNGSEFSRRKKNPEKVKSETKEVEENEKFSTSGALGFHNTKVVV